LNGIITREDARFILINIGADLRVSLYVLVFDEFL